MASPSGTGGTARCERCGGEVSGAQFCSVGNCPHSEPRVTEAAPARSYMLFDRASGNAVDGYDDVTAAHAALRQAVEDSPGEAETLALIAFDAAGMPVGDSVTFADLPPVAVPGPASANLGLSGGSCTCSGHARPGEPAVFDRSRCPIHGPAPGPAFVSPAEPPGCGWATGHMDCAVPGCKFPKERCLAVKRERDEAPKAKDHLQAAWMTAPPEADTADALIARFAELAACPQLRQSEGERCCGICLDELGWLALDLIPRLLPGDDYDR